MNGFRFYGGGTSSTSSFSFVGPGSSFSQGASRPHAGGPLLPPAQPEDFYRAVNVDGSIVDPEMVVFAIQNGVRYEDVRRR